MAAYQETFVFDGTAVVPASEVTVYGVDGDEALDYEAIGFTRMDSFFPEQLCILWKGDEDVYLVDISLDGTEVRTVKIDGFPMLLEFIRLYLHPIVAVQAFGIRQEIKTGEKKAA